MKKLLAFLSFLLCSCVLFAASDGFEKFTIIENDECAVIVTGLQDGPDYTVKTQLVNKSDSVTYMFGITEATINGVVCDPFFAARVVPGKRANKRISFNMNELRDIGVKEVTDIALLIKVHDANDWMGDSIVNEWVHIYPNGKQNAKQFVRTPLPTDTLVMDENNVRFTIIGYDYSDLLVPFKILIYLENNTDANLLFGANDASLDGFMIDPFFATSVPAHSSELEVIGWVDSALEENDISAEEISSVEFELCIYDDNDWVNPIFDDFIEINP